MAKIHKLSKNGQTIYPATTTDAVAHPTLKVSASKLIGEINVSNLYPTGGTDGTNKYTLASAIAKIPTDLRTVGIKCSFLNEAGEPETWEYMGGTFTNTASWRECGGRKLTELGSEVEKVGSNVNYLNNKIFGSAIEIEWELGSISNISGLDTTSETRYRTNFLPTSDIESIVLRSNNIVIFYNESKEKTTSFTDVNRTIGHEELVSNGFFVRLVDKKTTTDAIEIKTFVNSIEAQIVGLNDKIENIESSIRDDIKYFENLAITSVDGKLTSRITENIPSGSVIEISVLAESSVEHNVLSLLFWTNVNPQEYRVVQSIKCDGTKYRFTLSEDLVRISVTAKNLVPETQTTLRVELLSKFIILEKDVEVLKQKPLSGKTIVFFGDSVTEFGESTPYSDGNKVYYTDYIAEITGANVVNLGIGGTRIIPRSSSLNDTTDPLYQKIEITESMKAATDEIGSQRRNEYSNAIDGLLKYGTDLAEKKVIMQSIDLSKVDIVVIFGGTNDWTSRNRAADIKDSLRAAIEYMCIKYPHIQVCIVTPTKRWGNTLPDTSPVQIDPESWSDTYTRGGAFDLLPNIVDSLIDLAHEESVCVIDAYRTVGFNKINWEYYFYNSVTKATSTVHPNWLGIKQIGERFASYLLSNYRNSKPL